MLIIKALFFLPSLICCCLIMARIYALYFGCGCSPEYHLIHLKLDTNCIIAKKDCEKAEFCTSSSLGPAVSGSLSHSYFHNERSCHISALNIKPFWLKFNN